jgi:hypothetical protein
VRRTIGLHLTIGLKFYGLHGGPASIMKRLSSQYRLPLKELVHRADRVAADLNVLLVVIAIGLATLDATFLITQKVVDHLPPITRVSYDTAPPSAN